MQVYNNVLELIGNTPLVKLNTVTAGIKATVLAKVEFFNPGGSVKDRIGIRMIADAERRGLLKAGGTIVEPTSGNTGVGLALVAALRGYRAIFVMPDKMSEEKIRLLRAYGAEVVITPTAVPKDSPESYYSVAERLSREIPGAFQPNQYANMMNPKAHYDTTGPEIWDQTHGQVDVFIAGMGTGGTITGVARFLKEKNPLIRVIGADPEGSLFSSTNIHPYKVEGIGEDFIPDTIDLSLVDEIIQVTDKESFYWTRRLVREEGLMVGGSSGTALAAALRVAKQLPSGKVVVVLFPDSGRSYLSKIFSDDWMRENGFLEPVTPIRIADVLRSKDRRTPVLLSVTPGDRVQRAIGIMREYEVSQLPVLEGTNIVGSVQDNALMNLMFEDPDVSQRQIRDIMEKPFPVFPQESDVQVVYQALSAGHPAVIALEGERPVGVLTKSDLIDYLATVRAPGSGIGSPAAV